MLVCMNNETNILNLIQIPSTYGQERLNLLRQLEKVKEMKTSEANSDENTEEEEVEWSNLHLYGYGN